MFINRRNPPSRRHRKEGSCDPRACFPVECDTERDVYDADNEDSILERDYEDLGCAHGANYPFCYDETSSVGQPYEHNHLCGRANCAGLQKRSRWALRAVTSTLGPDGIILRAKLPQTWTSYHSALPKFRKSPSIKICGRNSRRSEPRLIDDYSIMNAPPPIPEHVLKIAPQDRWKWHPPLEQRIANWKLQEARERPQRELDETSIAVGPPTDVDELDDCWIPTLPLTELPLDLRYITRRNPPMKHVYDIGNRVSVTHVLDSDDTASIETTGSQAHSDATYMTALPPLDSDSGSSPADSVLGTPEGREEDVEFFFLRAEDSAESADEWQECDTPDTESPRTGHCRPRTRYRAER